MSLPGIAKASTTRLDFWGGLIITMTIAAVLGFILDRLLPALPPCGP